MEALLWLFPLPLPVPAGGSVWYVLPLRLKDISALLHLYWERDGGNPLNRRRAALDVAREACKGDYLADTDEGRAYAALLREAWPEVELNEYGRIGDLLDALFLIDGGLVAFLKLLIGRTHRDFDDRAAEALIPKLNRLELRGLIAAALAVHPADELGSMMDPIPVGSGKPDEWGRYVVEAMREGGCTLDQVGEMNLAQLRIVRAGGRFKPGGIDTESESLADRIGDRRERLFFGQGTGNGTGH
jgi:hypothetical protein